MKKGLIFTALLSLVLGLFSLSVHSTSAQEDSIDTYCQNNDPIRYEVIDSTESRIQIFTPTVNRITKIALKLGGNNAYAKYQVDLMEGTHTKASETQTVTDFTLQYRYFFNDLDPIEVKPGGEYKIKVSVLAGRYDPIYWYTTPSCEAEGAYAIGQDGKPALYNFDYTVWGYTYEEPVDEPSGDEEYTSEEQTVDNQTEEASSDENPAITTQSESETTNSETLGEVSELISAPENLTAVYSETDENRGVKLVWEESNTKDIEGYKVFRTETEGEDYKKVGETDADVLTYLDENIEASTTYYYIVRAYSGDLQSENSNEAEATTPEYIGPEKPRTLRVTDVTSNTISVAWTAKEDAEVSKYIVSLKKDGEEIASQELAGDITEAEFKDLEANTVYVISARAKDKSDKVSEPASVVQKTLEGNVPWYDMNELTKILLLTAVLMIAVLIYMIIRRRHAHS